MQIEYIGEGEVFPWLRIFEPIVIIRPGEGQLVDDQRLARREAPILVTFEENVAFMQKNFPWAHLNNYPVSSQARLLLKPICSLCHFDKHGKRMNDSGALNSV